MADKKQTPKSQNQQKSKEKEEKEEEEEEEPLQALRLKALAEQKYTSGDLTSALKYAKRAHNLRSNLAGVSEMLTAFNILNTARQAPVDNYYKFLQVERFSNINTIKKQYKKLALILHPDKNPFVASEEAFKLVGEAFRVLSDKVRRNEYDMKLRISMQAEVVGPVEEGEVVATFWTACSTCRLLHKFERKYLGHNLVCPSCKKSFKAVEVSENVKEGEGEGEGEEEENSGVGHMRGSARVRERKGGKLRDSENVKEGKRKIDSVGKVSERLKGKMAKTMGGNEGKSEGLRPKEVEKGNYEGAGGDAESGGMIGGLRLRSGRKVRVGSEVEERTRTKRVNVGEEEMMTIAEMQTIAKRKLSEEKMKVKGKEREEVKMKGREKKGEEVKEKGKEKEEERGKEKEKEKEEERAKEIDKAEKEEERRKEKEKVQEEEKEKEIGEGEIAVVKMKEKREAQGISKNENLGVVKRRASVASAIEKEKELEEIRGKEIEKEEKEEERRREKEKVQEDGREKEKVKEIGEGESEEEMAVVKMKEKRETRGISKNENVGVVKRRASETLGIEKEKELEELKENEKEKEWKEGTEKDKESGAEREKEKEMSMVKVREKRERRKTWKLESLEVEKRREEKMKEKEREEETETSIVNVKEKRDRRKTSKIGSFKVMKRRKEKETEKEMEEKMEKEIETIMIKVKEKRDRRKTSKNESLEVMKTRALKSGNMEVKKHKESRQSSLEIVALEDSDFYDFGKVRLGRNFKKGQVWALYDDDDGMPRHYAVIDEVVSVNPFELRLNWLEFQSKGDEALISWEKLGFRISCGRFKVSTSIVVKSLKIFSHVADCERAARELYRIYPKKGSVWAIYNESALDAEGRNLMVKNKRCYDIVVFLTTYSEVHGLSMAYLEKVDGFRTVFQRREIGAHAIRWLEKEDYRLFSHQIPARKLSGEETSGLPKDCWELDPASIPPESLTIGWKR